MQRLRLLLGSGVLLYVFSACGVPAPSGGEATQALAALATTDDALLPSAEADAARCADQDVPRKYQAFARAFEAERQALGVPGAAVAIMEHGRVTFAHGFGTKGPTSTKPVRATTLFRIGSMTKALTTTAVLSLVDEHKLSLDTKLKDVVPDVALAEPELSSLTVRHLLSHQSGLVDGYAADASHDDSVLSSVCTSEAFRASEYFMDPPGSFWNYSNPNFSLAGLVAERLDGAIYRTVMARRVFEPLHMKRTFFLGSDVLADGDFAVGKSTDASGNLWEVYPDSYDNAWLRPAGFAYSSVLDYANFVRFLYSGTPRALSPRMRAAMQRTQVSTLTYGAEDGYGLGLFVSQGVHPDATTYYPTVMVSHGGDINGFAGDFYLQPSTGFGMVVLAAADGAHFTSSAALALQSFGELPAPTSPPPDVAVDPSTFPQLVGTYVDPHLLGPVTVSVADGVVQVAIPGFDAAGIPYDPVVKPWTADNFVITTAPYGAALVTFVRDQTGVYRWLRTRIAVFTRQDASTAAPAQALTVDAARVHERLRDATKPSPARSARMLER